MLGSTFISETDPEKLNNLGQDLEALGEFDHVSLDMLCTLDFEMATSKFGFKWMTGEPLVYDAENGFVIAKISPGGVASVLNEQNEFDEEQAADLETLRAFVKTHGTENLYELATF